MSQILTAQTSESCEATGSQQLLASKSGVADRHPILSFLADCSVEK
jgi:hypothetical protein